ncbi:tripartite tricarboxylate transporter substrate binding protein [Comamonas faecalis]|uniref:Tripartite tricarboxylate transporter substrate binding protein n=1 Tax=Comamonas faecalis TaxID=1387849 RepID=A0ABP7RRY8_9BURK
MQSMTRRQWLATGLGGAAALAAPHASWAQAAYPTKPVRVIVPFAAGGTTDVVARLVLQKMTELCGQSFIVENKGGAGGMIGTEQVARATPDGYTLLLNTAGAQTLSPVIYKAAKYEALDSFEPITHICDVSFIVIAREGLPVSNMQELIALARGPKPLSMSSGSSMINLMSEEFKRVIGAPETINVQYKGTAPQMQAVVAGEVDFSLDSFASVEMIRAGRVKALAVFSHERAASFPDVPTLTELGIKGMDFASWAGLLAPKGTPKEIVGYLAQQMDKVMQMPDVLDKLRSYDYLPKRTSPEEFGKLIAADNARWKRIVAETGFKVS